MQHFFQPFFMSICKLLKVKSSACMNWYEVAKCKSSDILWHSTIQLIVWVSLRTGKPKKSKGIKYSLLKPSMDGITGQVSPLDGDNGDNLRLLSASCLCLLALHSLFLPCLCCDRACCSCAHHQSPGTALMEHFSGGYRQLHTFMLLVTMKVCF